MEDHRQIALLGQPQMAVEIFLLKRKRGEIPVAVQARLAEGHDAGMADQGRRRAPNRRRRPRRSSWDGCPRPPADRTRSASRTHGPARSGGNGRAENRLDAGRTRPGDHLAAIGVELRLVQMGVGVEER